jgi:electron transport complex protein RnfD
VITWHIPVVILATVFLVSSLLWILTPGVCAPPAFHILTGGIVLGAVFMATDYSTSPMTTKGMLIYAALIGLLTILIRVYGSYPEGISFAILILNALTPFINKYCKPYRFGEGK